MRFYDIYIDGAPAAFTPTDSGAIWSTFLNGNHNPSAQQIEFQIEEMTKAPIPSPNSTMTVQGISFEQIKQSSSLIGKNITMYGGMSRGLPFATQQAGNAGLLMKGTIFKCWGNWIGTEMSLGLAFVPSGTYVNPDSDSTPDVNTPGSKTTVTPEVTTPPGLFTRTGARSLDRMSFPRAAASAIGIPAIPLGGVLAQIPLATFGDASATVNGITTSLFGGGGGGLSLIKPLNLIHNLMPNMPLKDGIQQTLSKAFPKAKLNILIREGLKLAYQDAGMHQNLDQYSQYIQKLSNSIAGTKNYLGVHMSSHSDTIDVWDGTTPVTEGVISNIDLIGQPTWIDINKISIKTVLRADLHVGGTVTLPPTLINVTEQSTQAWTSEQKATITFTGSFLITKVLHIGDFRNPDGSSWSSNYEALVTGSPEAEVAEASFSSDQ
jgi:hypothetical protein